MKICLRWTVALVVMVMPVAASVQAFPLHRIEITSVGFARPAEQRVVHEAICGDRTYRLRVSQNPARVDFESSRQRVNLDISHTPLATALLSRSHWGEVHVSCPEGGMHATFIGFRFRKGKAGVPFSYGMSIFEDGEVRNHDDSNLHAADEVKRRIDRMAD